MLIIFVIRENEQRTYTEHGKHVKYWQVNFSF